MNTEPAFSGYEIGEKEMTTENEKLLPMPDEIYIQFGENRVGAEKWPCLRQWQGKPFQGGTKYIRVTQQPIDAWLPIETAPKDGTEILVFGFFIGEVSGRQREKSIGVASWYFGNCWLASNTDKYAGEYDATHWMPLPKPPEDQEYWGSIMQKAVEDIEIEINADNIEAIGGKS